MQENNTISAQHLIDEWIDSTQLQDAFLNNLYQYSLYVCGGDFTLFDNMKLIFDQILLEQARTGVSNAPVLGPQEDLPF